MAKQDLVKMTCDFCGYSDTIDVRENAERVLKTISKWIGIMKGDAAPNTADSHKWYDCPECAIAALQGEMKTAAATDQAEAAITKAN